MKRLLLIMLAVTTLTARAQSDKPTWYGYPQDRQVASAAGFLSSGIFYPVIRTANPEAPKWHAMVISTGVATVVGATIAAMPNQSATQRRQNFTATLVSGLTVTLTFSLGI
jgi:hypothetical protein